jgi:hypothetical protein
VTATTLIVFAVLLGQSREGATAPYFTEEVVGPVAWSVMEAPDEVTVRLAYLASKPDPGGEKPGVRFFGDAVPVERDAWHGGWIEAKSAPSYLAWLMLSKGCTFHPDRLVTLKRGDQVVHLVTCHRCDQALIYAPDREKPLKVPLVGFDRSVLDGQLPMEWHAEAILEEQIGRENLRALRSGSPVFVALGSAKRGFVFIDDMDAVPAAEWRPASRLLVEALLVAGASAEFERRSELTSRRQTDEPVIDLDEPYPAAVLIQVRPTSGPPVTLAAVPSHGFLSVAPAGEETLILAMSREQMGRILRAAGLTVR